MTAGLVCETEASPVIHSPPEGREQAQQSPTRRQANEGMVRVITHTAMVTETGPGGQRQVNCDHGWGAVLADGTSVRVFLTARVHTTGIPVLDVGQMVRISEPCPNSGRCSVDPGDLKFVSPSKLARRTAEQAESGVALARAFALAAHGDQRYGSLPYSHHLDAVAALLAPYGEQAQVVGYLHDTVEDTETMVTEIRDRFGPEIAECVSLVTDEHGANRRERKAKTNAKLAATSNQTALIVKAADRLANLQASVQTQANDKLQMYRREHDAFRQAVYRSGLCDELWDQIDDIIGRRTV
jgi:hypothetical protein